MKTRVPCISLRESSTEEIANKAYDMISGIIIPHDHSTAVCTYAYVTYVSKIFIVGKNYGSSLLGNEPLDEIDRLLWSWLGGENGCGEVG